MKRVELSPSEYVVTLAKEQNKVVVESSQMGLEPGEWPQFIEVQLKGREPLPLVLKRTVVYEDFVSYVSEDGVYRFEVIND